LKEELLHDIPPSFTTIAGYTARHTHEFLRNLEGKESELE
jgi:hypothetical protein